MRKMTARRAMSAIVALPIVLIANTTEALASISTQKADPIKQASDFDDELDFDVGVPTPSSIEESEDWDEPDFSATLDMEISRVLDASVEAATDGQALILIDGGAVTKTDAQLPRLDISAARGQSTRECRISGICE